MTKAERAIVALREAADALEDLPIIMRRRSLLGPIVNVVPLREEADFIEGVVESLSEAVDASVQSP